MNAPFKMFGNSKTQIWELFSQEIQAKLIDCESENRSKLIAKIDNWTVTIDTHIQQTQHNKYEFIRIRSPFVNKDGFRFRISPEGIFDKVEKLFGGQDIQTGFPEFDSKFIIQSNNDEKIKYFCSSTTIQDKLKSQNNVYFEIRNDDGYFSEEFPEGVDELYFMSKIDNLNLSLCEECYDLFAESLHLLCHMGSAYENDPNIQI